MMITIKYQVAIHNFKAFVLKTLLKHLTVDEICEPYNLFYFFFKLQRYRQSVIILLYLVCIFISVFFLCGQYTFFQVFPLNIKVTFKLLNCYTWESRRCPLSVNNYKRKIYTKQWSSFDVYFYVYLVSVSILTPLDFRK